MGSSQVVSYCNKCSVTNTFMIDTNSSVPRWQHSGKHFLFYCA